MLQDREVEEEGSKRSRKTRYITLFDPDTERHLEVKFRELMNLCKPKHAWARTIHTFQVGVHLYL